MDFDKVWQMQKNFEFAYQAHNFLTTLSTMDPKQKEEMSESSSSSSSNNDKFNIENFLNPITRENTFQMLFNEVCLFVYFHEWINEDFTLN